MKWSQSPRSCEDGGPQTVQGTIAAAHPAAIRTLAIPPQSIAGNVLNNVPGDTHLLLMPGEPIKKRVHAQTSKDLKHKENPYTKTDKVNGSNTVAAATGFL